MKSYAITNLTTLSRRLENGGVGKLTERGWFGHDARFNNTMEQAARFSEPIAELLARQLKAVSPEQADNIAVVDLSGEAPRYIVAIVGRKRVIVRHESDEIDDWDDPTLYRTEAGKWSGGRTWAAKFTREKANRLADRLNRLGRVPGVPTLPKVWRSPREVELRREIIDGLERATEAMKAINRLCDDQPRDDYDPDDYVRAQ